MSQQITRSVNDSTGKSKQNAQSYHPVWMAHWMRTSNSTSEERHSLGARPKEEVESVKEPVMETKTLFLKNLESVKDGVNFPSKIITAADELSLRGNRSPGEGTSNNPLEWMKTRYSDKGKGAEFIHGRKMESSRSNFNTCSLFGSDRFHKMQQFPGVRFPPTPSEEDKTNESQFDFHSLKKFPNGNNSVRDLETMRICTTVDSVEAMPGGCPTTHSLSITKKADVNLLQENDVFRATRLVKKTDENTRQGNGGVKLDGENNVRNVEGCKVTIKNESSAETYTTEMDCFKEQRMNSGANSTPSTKAINIDTNSPLPNVLDPSNQWVKRLKVSSSNSSYQGTKISNPGKSSSHDKMRNCFRSMLDNGITGSEPSPIYNKNCGKGCLWKDKKLLLSHVWIKRWLRNGSTFTKHKPNQTVENSKMSIDDVGGFEKKQFPSIGAMALMGKATRDFQSPEIQKRGSVTVWNIKEGF